MYFSVYMILCFFQDEFEHYLDDDVEHYFDDDDDNISSTNSNERFYGTGKRKTSIARVWIYDGSGQFIVNGKKAIDYFNPVQREYCIQPLVTTRTIGYFDVWCTVKGGGYTGKMCHILLEIIYHCYCCHTHMMMMTFIVVHLRI